MNKAFGDEPFVITPPTSNSNGTFSYESSNQSVATISGNTVTIVGAGSTTITATQAATDNYSSGSISATFVVEPFATIDVGLVDPTINTILSLSKSANFATDNLVRVHFSKANNIEFSNLIFRVKDSDHNIHDFYYDSYSSTLVTNSDGNYYAVISAEGKTFGDTLDYITMRDYWANGASSSTPTYKTRVLNATFNQSLVSLNTR
jgi:hypothetical protein